MSSIHLRTLKTRAVKTAAIGGLCLIVCAGILLAFRTSDRRRAEVVLQDLRLLDYATELWAIKLGKTSRDLPTWDNCKECLQTDQELVRIRSEELVRRKGKDVLGHAYIIGTGLESVSVDPRTIRALAWVVDPRKLTIDSQGERRIRPPEIILAARQGNVTWLRELIKDGADIDQPDAAGETPLFWAAKMGHAEVARAICSLHPNPRTAITRGYPSPMGEACTNHAGIVAVFLDYDVHPEPSDLDYAARYADVLKVLLARGMSPDAENSIGEPILLTAAYGSKDAVRVLIAAGAKVNVKRKDGETALQIASHERDPEIAEMLRRTGATL